MDKMNVNIYIKGGYAEFYPLNAAKNKAKQSQLYRSTFCVLRTAKMNLKKQSQFFIFLSQIRPKLHYIARTVIL